MSFQGRIDTTEFQMTSFTGGLVAGTNIRTPCGARRIELVRPGDMIVTRTAGLQPVRMIWKRLITQEQMRQNPDLAPIRLTARAIGPMMPQQDLLVAPDHRLLIPGFRVQGMPDNQCVLAEARELAGTSDAVYIDRSHETVAYYQMVFDSHQVFAASGLPVESFLPTAEALSTLGPDMRDDLIRRYPQLKREPGSYPPAEFKIASGIEYLPHHA